MKYLTTKQVAEKIGVHYTTIWRYVKKKGLPVVRLSPTSMRFSEEAVDKWLEERSCKGD